MKKLLLLSIVLILLSSCSMYELIFNPFIKYETDFQNNLNDDSLLSPGTIGDLFDCNNEDWDIMIYYGPYSYSRAIIKEDLGIDSLWVNDSTNDGDWLLLFIDRDDKSNILKYLIEGKSYEVSIKDFNYTEFFKLDKYTKIGKRIVFEKGDYSIE